jgi:hypothetical protein
MHCSILQPVVVLAGWTLVVLVWLMARRLPALRAMGIDLRKSIGSRGSDLEGRVAGRIQWPAHNYIHLVEKPTVFYAVAVTLALAGAGGGVNAGLAWAYALLRIAHSLWQMTVNVVSVRFMLFAASSLTLIALTVRAAMAVF